MLDLTVTFNALMTSRCHKAEECVMQRARWCEKECVRIFASFCATRASEVELAEVYFNITHLADADFTRYILSVVR